MTLWSSLWTDEERHASQIEGHSIDHPVSDPESDPESDPGLPTHSVQQEASPSSSTSAAPHPGSLVQTVVLLCPPCLAPGYLPMWLLLSQAQVLHLGSSCPASSRMPPASSTTHSSGTVLSPTELGVIIQFLSQVSCP